MIYAEEVRLDITLPDDGLGMVIMQPYVELNGQEPYQWLTGQKNKQFDRMIKTLEIANQSDHGCEKTHFTIFPEYSIPGLEGIQKIQEIVGDSSWKAGTIIIAGIDGLTKDDYSALCDQDLTEVHEENAAERLRNDQWVNCCVIWTKQADGLVKKWIQPKFVPATREELCPARHMFQGKALYVFRPEIQIQSAQFPFRFLSFICKDWIGSIGASSVINLALSKIDELRGQDAGRLDIYLCFLLNRNDQPDNPLFLQNTSQYINENSHIAIRRSDGAVLFVNNAGREGPGRCTNFGKSGFVFHPNCSFVSHQKYCPPTYTLKARQELASCKEARFRENGSCIFSFKFLPPIPAIVRMSPSTPKIPVNPAIVHSVDTPTQGIEVDPRTPGQEVPASVKWVNDCLDSMVHLLEHEIGHPLRNRINDTHTCIRKEIGKEGSEFLCRYITMASCGIEEEDKWVEIGKVHNVDNWQENEENNLKTVVYALSIIKTSKPLQVKGSVAHATIRMGNKAIDVIVVSGDTHGECFKYARNQFVGSIHRFVIVVTHDRRSSLPGKKIGKSIFDVEYDKSRGPHIADPPSRFDQCGYQNLVDGCFHARTLVDLEDKVTEIMGF